MLPALVSSCTCFSQVFIQVAIVFKIDISLRNGVSIAYFYC